MVESLPELEWKGYAPFIHAATPIGRYNIDNFGIWLLRFNGKEIPLPTGSFLEAAKQAANEHYKKRIKQVLGVMNGITINDKQYIFIATNEDYIIHCDKCDLTKDGHSLSCNALCATFHELTLWTLAGTEC